MRVLIVTREYPPASEGGISRRLTNLVPGLLKAGVDIGVVCFNGASQFGERVFSLAPKGRILYTRSGEPSLRDAPSILTDIWRLDRKASGLLSTGAYDLVQIEEPVFGPFISASVPRVVTTHVTQVGEFHALFRPSRITRGAKRLAFSGSIGWIFDGLCLKTADIVVAVSETVMNEVHKFYGIKDEKIRVIPNGVDFPKQLDKLEAKRKIGLNNFLFIYAGRLVHRKRVDDFLRALSMLRERGFKDFSAYVVGSGPTQEFLTELACGLGLARCVQFTGHVSDDVFFRLLEAADVFVMPSSYEGLPISVMEAMAYGCVPVVTNIPQMLGIVHSGENGLVYPLGDLRSLCNALDQIASDAALRTSISSKARESVKGLSWTTATNEHIRIYDSLVE